MAAGAINPDHGANNGKLFFGELALDGSNPTPIPVAFRQVDGVTLTLKGSAAPADLASVLTYDVVNNADGSKTVNVYAWQNTGGTDPTLVASAGTATFSYLVAGA
jgi:hypothetical protein